jgi:hypothetical protein
MIDTKETKKEKLELQPSRAARDLILLIVFVILVFILSYFFNVFILIVKFLEKYPDKSIYIDEVISVLLALSIGLSIFSWRRWLELKRETAERIKKQEELVKIANTQAEVERIVSKQLRSDMDEIKGEVREILQLVLSKCKRRE